MDAAEHRAPVGPDGDRSKIGSLAPEDYAAVSGALRENGLIGAVAEFGSFFVPAGEYAEK